MRAVLDDSYLSVAKVTWQRKDQAEHPERPFLRNPRLEEEIEWFRRWSDRVECYRESADQICNHSFETPATGHLDWGWPPRWHQDVRSGYQWPVDPYPVYRKLSPPGRGIDIRVPRELSRGYHLVALAQAWVLTREERYAAECLRYWGSWVEENPPGQGIHWASTLEVAIRTMHWLWAFALLEEAPVWTSKRLSVLFDSLQLHGLHIEHNLEVSVRDGAIMAANHYLGSVSALACLGMLCPRIPQSRRWVEAGWKGLQQEIQRQVLPDGFHFETSTGYHCLALEMFLVPALVAGREGRQVPEDYWRRLEEMVDVLPFLSRPDRSMVRLGDDDNGRFLALGGLSTKQSRLEKLLILGRILFKRDGFPLPPADCREEVFWLLGRKGVEELLAQGTVEIRQFRSHHFREAGWLIWRNGNSYLAFRSGPALTGATAHAHSDLFSVELWVGGFPIVHDPGTGSYTGDPVLRNQLRSSHSHNVVLVDGHEIVPFDLDELFALKANGIRSEILSEEIAAGSLDIEVEHNAYRRLKDPVTHRRSLCCQSDGGSVTIHDRLTGKEAHEALWCWNLHPERELRSVEETGSGVRVELDCLLLEMTVQGGQFAEAEVVPALASHSYGQVVQGQRLEVGCQWQGDILVTTCFLPQFEKQGVLRKH